MKKCVCCFLLFVALPLAAQKNLLPAAKAALGENVAKSVARQAVAANAARQIAGQAALRHTAAQASAVVPGVRVPAAGKNAPVESRQRVFGKQLAQPFSPRLEINAIQFFNSKKFMQTLQKKDAFLQQLDCKHSKPSQQFAATLQQINALKKQYASFNKDFSFELSLAHLTEFSRFAEKNNQMVLAALPHYVQQIQWVRQYPNQARHLLAQESGPAVFFKLARRLEQEKLVIVGEYHFVRPFQRAIMDLLLAAKKQYPARRVVLFTEFLALPEQQFASAQTLESYYRRILPGSLPPQDLQDITEKVYAKQLFRDLLKNQVEIYPLEDGQQRDLIIQQGFRFHDTPLAVSMRNKTWARVIETKMAEIRQTDPDALFIVYVGLGHSSWIKPVSLPKFFAAENPVVIELSLNSDVAVSSAANLWAEDEDFFTHPPRQTSFFFWKGADAKALAKHTGFDYLLVVPQDPLEKGKGKNEIS